MDQNNNGQDLPCEKYRQFLDSSVEQRTFMIEKLVETFANTIDSIWHPKFLTDKQPVKVMPTRGFCSVIFKRSKATYSTLQISLFYIYRVKRAVHEKLYQRAQLNKDMQTSNKQEDLMCCGRRMFLASLMVASKYLHDKNYHNKAWAKITGLDIKEINAAEMAFLNLIDYQLYISKPTFDIWYTRIHGYIENSYKSSSQLDLKNTISNDPNNITSMSQQEDSVQNIIKDQQEQSTLTSSNGTRTIQLNNCNYPSPPPDPSAQSLTTDKTFQRNDSGVSFDIMSPPSVGTKRHLISEESINKRICH
ncbi:hypothetical protein BD770DRAFT_327928 [Pilaira anomala]|nr:hypothetical protein BD770DRAFT_327928 [Pilaira anomala]